MSRIQTCIVPVSLSIKKKPDASQTNKKVSSRQSTGEQKMVQQDDTRNTEVGEQDGAKHAAKEDKQKSKH